MSESIVESNDTEVLNFEVGGESNVSGTTIKSMPQHPQVKELPPDPDPDPPDPPDPSLATNAVSAGANTVATAVSAAPVPVAPLREPAPAPAPERVIEPKPEPVLEFSPSAAEPPPLRPAAAPLDKGKAVSQFQFHVWFHALFQALLDFSTMSCSTLDGTSDKALGKLRETIQRLKALSSEITVPAPCVPARVGAIITRARQTLPSSISDMLAIIFKRVDEIHRKRLEAELEWTREWTRLHVAVLELYLRVAVQVHQQWSQDLKRVHGAVEAWGARVNAMVRPERARLMQCFERQAGDWLQFCDKYAQALREQGLDVSSLIDEQKALLTTLPSPEEMGWGAKLPLTFAIQGFMQQCENPVDRARRAAPPPVQLRAQERLEEQRRRLEQLHQLEDDMLRNRRAKHRIWSAVQQQQLSSTAVEQIQALEEEYHAQQRDACLLATLVRESTPAPADAAAGGGEGSTDDDGACPPAEPQRMDLWRRCAAKILPAAPKLEQRILEVEGTPKRLHRIILETHDEFIKKALSSICSNLNKLRAQQVDGLNAKLSLTSEELQRSGAAAKQQMQTLLEEAADHCRAHPEAFRSLYHLHDSIRQRQEAEARHAARRHSLEQVRQFMENDPNLRTLLHNNEQSRV